jgi:purine-nucleoside phosphorylase
MTAASKPSLEFTRASRAAKFILSKTKLRPRIGLVLGSGLGAFADDLASAARIDYRRIPHFPRSTAVGHAGKLVIGKVGDVAVVAMQGRVHFYEGYSLKEVILPMRVFAAIRRARSLSCAITSICRAGIRSSARMTSASARVFRT